MGSARASRAGDRALAVADFLPVVRVWVTNRMAFGEGAETSTRAAPKPRTGITDSGYNGSWSVRENLRGRCLHSCGQSPPRLPAGVRMSRWLDWNRSGFRLRILYRCRYDGRGHRWDRCRDRHSGWWRYARCCGKYQPCSKSRRSR